MSLPVPTVDLLATGSTAIMALVTVLPLAKGLAASWPLNAPTIWVPLLNIVARLHAPGHRAISAHVRLAHHDVETALALARLEAGWRLCSWRREATAIFLSRGATEEFNPERRVHRGAGHLDTKVPGLRRGDRDGHDIHLIVRATEGSVAFPLHLVATILQIVGFGVSPVLAWIPAHHRHLVNLYFGAEIDRQRGVGDIGWGKGLVPIITPLALVNV
mmetsp:Transcript_22541/g.49826  ORF Transcript_22541/g.49826 Transcript_22541/m.49826 type:complete len:217 (-) Transcript_22541:231-881(-)